MRVTLVLLAVLLVGGDLACGKHHRRFRRPSRYRIVNGRQAYIEEFPYQVSLERNEHQFCGGSILNEMVVVTAAHCIQSFKGFSKIPKYVLQVRVGSNYSNIGGETYAVDKVLQHENYGQVPDSNDHDIAIVFLQYPITFSKSVQPIQYTRRKPQAGEMTWVTGYGSTVEQRQSFGTRGRHLMAVELPVLDYHDCRYVYEHEGVEFTKNMLCAGFMAIPKDSCKGDSGGPMVLDGVLVGIVSWGIGCARLHLPGVYVNVAKYATWLDMHINDHRRSKLFDFYRAYLRGI